MKESDCRIASTEMRPDDSVGNTITRNTAWQLKSFRSATKYEIRGTHFHDFLVRLLFLTRKRTQRSWVDAFVCNRNFAHVEISHALNQARREWLAQHLCTAPYKLHQDRLKSMLIIFAADPPKAELPHLNAKEKPNIPRTPNAVSCRGSVEMKAAPPKRRRTQKSKP